MIIKDIKLKTIVKKIPDIQLIIYYFQTELNDYDVNVINYTSKKFSFMILDLAMEK